MPLTDFQIALAACLAENRTFDSYLAGGAAILIEPNTERYSNDLDYFHDSEQRVADAFAADRTLLEAHGYTLRVDLNLPGYVRAVVRLDERSTKVEWARDSSWRFMPTVRHERFGFVLHPTDLAINKVLALAGRDEPVTCWTRCISIARCCASARCAGPRAARIPGSRPSHCWTCCGGADA